MFKGVKQEFIHLVTKSTIPYFNKTILLAELEFTDLCLGYPYFLPDKKRVQSEYYGVSVYILMVKYLKTINTFFFVFML